MFSFFFIHPVVVDDLVLYIAQLDPSIRGNTLKVNLKYSLVVYVTLVKKSSLIE
jgi:hypothetical protein